MTTPGEFRRRARRQASKPEATPREELTPLEVAIARKLRTLASEEAPKEADARAIAFQVVKHWGDDAPKVLQLATEYVRDEVGRWIQKPTKTTDPTPSGGSEGGEGR